ncbi:MAG TPA: hypothetical protein VEY10_08210 [Flavisolibacter sp.]|jgi:hypothetical protein|nr:hypothetical protein [Flavisolibacter sp.]
MRNSFRLSFISALIITLPAFTNDVLQQLAIDERAAKEAIKDNFIRGGLYFPDNNTIKTIALAKQATTVSALGGYIKQYIHSAEFAQAYDIERKLAVPAGKADVKELIKMRLKEIDREITTTEENLKTSNGDFRKLHELSIASLKDEKKALQDPKNLKYTDYVENLLEAQNEQEEQTHLQAKAYSEDYPSTVNELVKKRLGEFLALTAGINFNTQLVQQGKFRVFADPVLEAKDGNWKKCFRAGPATINAARKYAQQWLQELESKKESLF